MTDDDQRSQLLQKVLWVEERLCSFYGPRKYDPQRYDPDILGALIATVLSQHTSDINSSRAYQSLKGHFPGGWDSVRLSTPDEIIEAIRCGGLAQVKSVRIQQLLEDVKQRTGATSLDFLREWTDDRQIFEFLTAFTGIGPKTAACVLLFNLGRPAIPVDTHVHRVSKRIGLIGPKVSADRAHRELLDLVAPQKAYEFHVHLIEHGRRICHAQRPACHACPVAARCDYSNSLRDAQLAQATGS